MKYNFLVCMFVCLLLTSNILLSQTPYYQKYSREDNLSHVEIHCAYQARDGHLWFGADNAVYRFDGRTFTPFTIKKNSPPNRVREIIGDAAGNLWIATQTGVSHFSNGDFKHYTQQDGLINDNVTCVAKSPNGDLWFGTFSGLSCFNGQNFKNFTDADGIYPYMISSLICDDDGRLWIGHAAGGLVCFYNNRFVRQNYTGGYLDHGIYGLHFDSNGKLWMGTQQGAVYISAGKLTHIPTGGPQGHTNVNTICEDDLGNIVMGTWDGVCIRSPQGQQQCQSKFGLPNGFVTDIIRDTEGNLWITSFRGISCLKSINLKRFTVSTGLADDYVNAVLEDKQGNFWIGTHSGLNYYCDHQMKTFNKETNLIDNRVFDLLEDNHGNIWIATMGGLNVYDGKKFTAFTEENGLPSNFVYCLYKDQKGTVWAGTRFGICTFQNGKVAPPPLVLPDLSVRRIFHDTKNNLWLCTFKGAFKYSPEGNLLAQYSTQNGLSSDSINTICQDKTGHIWLGTDRGLSYVDGKTIKNFSDDDGILQARCSFILNGNNDELWIGTYNGLFFFDGRKFRHISAKSNGLLTDTWKCAYKDSKGGIWLGGLHGLNTFTPPLKINTVPPPVHITSVQVMNKNVSLSEPLKVTYDANNIKIHFTGICYSAPQSVTYRIRLEGSDQKWTTTHEGTAFYPSLPAGKYTFRVDAFNNHGVKSLEPAVFSFEILPPFWETWWFYALSFILFWVVMFLVIFFFFKRVSDKKELQNRTHQLLMSQRMELVGMLAAGAVHDMKNLMTIIIGYSNVMRMDTDMNPRNLKLLESIKDTANTAVHMVKQILKFSLQKLSTATTPIHMVNQMNEIVDLIKVTTPKRITLIWEPPNKRILFKIDPVALQQVLMNLTINAFDAMPKAGTVKITLDTVEEKEIRITVADTGTGMEKDVADKIFNPLFTTKEEGAGTGLGLFVVRQIVTDHNGTVSVESEPGKGTTFTILFPLETTTINHNDKPQR